MMMVLGVGGLLICVWFSGYVCGRDAQHLRWLDWFERWQA